MSVTTNEKNVKATAPAPAPQDDRQPSRFKTIKEDWNALDRGDKILGLLRALGVLIYIAVPVFLFLYRGKETFPEPDKYPNYLAVDWTGGRVIWTVVIAVLPFIIVAMGFYRWRQICPLAFWTRMSEWLEWPDRRDTPSQQIKRKRMPRWLAENYPVVTWGFLTAMLAVRILLVNSNPIALGLTFIGLAIMAIVVGFIYTGKTWCNYICPVSTIQKIYMDCDKPNYKDNSMCPKCTGCKTIPSGSGRCPDINMENDYWQELKLPSRAWAYYAWPGVVLGFYTWYFLHKPYYWHEMMAHGVSAMRHIKLEIPQGVMRDQVVSTDWGFYMSGDWTRNPHPWEEWTTQAWGFHNMPAFLAGVPTIIGVPITLLAFATAFYTVFRVMEAIGIRIRMRKMEARATGEGHPFTDEERKQEQERSLERVRHSLFCISGFVAFNLFYTFAGAPTFRLFPEGYKLFSLAVVIFSTWVLTTRLRRSRDLQLQYDQSRTWVKKWPFPNEKPPLDPNLERIYTEVTLRLKASKDRLRVYKESVRSMLADRTVTASELGMLDKLSKDMGLSEKEKKDALRDLKKETPQLFERTTADNLDNLRLVGYQSELERAISDNNGTLPPIRELTEMQVRYRIEPGEHEKALQEIRNPQGERARNLRLELEALQEMRREGAVLAANPSPVTRFLLYEMQANMRDDRDHILQVVNLYGPAGELDLLRAAIRRGESAAYEKVSEWVRDHLTNTDLAELVVTTVCSPELPAVAETGFNALAEVLLRLAKEQDLYLRAPAVFALRMIRTNAQHGVEANSLINAMLADPFPLVREAAVAALAPDMSVELWNAALNDPSDWVRRCAMDRIAVPVPAELNLMVMAARNDSDTYVREAATNALNGIEPTMLEGRRILRLTVVERLFALRGVEVMSHLPSAALHDLARRIEEEAFDPGEALCQEGEPGDWVYIILAGQTVVTKLDREHPDRENVVGYNKPGQCVGELAILYPGPRNATVRARESLRTLSVQGEDFRSLLSHDATASMSVIRQIIQHQRETEARMAKTA